MKQVRQFTRLPCLQMPVGTHLSITHPLSESGRRFAVTDLEGSFVTNSDSLSAHYANPTERVLKKRLDHVNAVGRAFIAASPFLVLATGSREGLDCSPKGDRPGFVEVADDGRTLLIPDRRGNNLIDGLRNLVEDARIGLIFFVPGERDLPRERTRSDQHGCGPQAPLRCQWQGASDSDGCDGRTGISALPKGAGPVRPVEGGTWRPAPRPAAAGGLRGGARAGNKRLPVARRVQRTQRERGLVSGGRHGWGFGFGRKEERRTAR